MSPYTQFKLSQQPTFVWVGYRKFATQLEASSLFSAVLPPDLVSSHLQTVKLLTGCAKAVSMYRLKQYLAGDLARRHTGRELEQ